ncbi:unnamed protein product [Lactuca virosa]|uniref:Uncharacterized protein n=1 Tax=Lactuca virosa TaxID=75947 RepID=A0AAU9MUA6_9ASTR|nr:unnamed protein product [Lactuca virosa]
MYVLVISCYSAFAMMGALAWQANILIKYQFLFLRGGRTEVSGISPLIKFSSTITIRFLVGGHNVKMSDAVIVEASGGLWFLAFEGCDCYMISAGLKFCGFLSFNAVNTAMVCWYHLYCDLLVVGFHLDAAVSISKIGFCLMLFQ